MAFKTVFFTDSEEGARKDLVKYEQEENYFDLKSKFFAIFIKRQITP